MQVNYLVASDLLSWVEKGSVIRRVVSLLDQNGALVTTAPTTVSVQFTNPLGATVGPFTLAGAQVVAGTGALGTTNTPLGSWYYDLTTNQSGQWTEVWTTTGPAAKVTSDFYVVDNGPQ